MPIRRRLASRVSRRRPAPRRTVKPRRRVAFRRFRRRSKAALVLQRLFRRKRGRVRRPAVSGRRVYRLHQQLSHQQILPLRQITAENFAIPQIDFLTWNEGSPVPGSTTTSGVTTVNSGNMVIFGFHLGPSQQDMFPGFQALGGLDPKEHFGTGIIQKLHTQDEDQNGDNVERGHGHSRELVYPNHEYAVESGGAVQPAHFDEAHGVAHAADTDLHDQQTIVNPMALSRYYHLGMTKMQWKIQMNWSAPATPNVGDAYNLDARPSHHYEFRRIVFCPKRIVVHPGTSLGFDSKHTHITQAQMDALNLVATAEAGITDGSTKAIHTDHYNQFSNLTDYFPYADWRYTLFLGLNGAYWGPANGKPKFMERMWNTGRTILRRVVNAVGSNVAEKVFNTVAGQIQQGHVSWRDIFYSAAFAAKSVFTDAELSIQTYTGWGTAAMTVLSHYQSIIGNNNATLTDLRDEIDHMRQAATREARDNMFIAPINKKHFKVFSDRKFKMKGANVFKDSAASTKTWTEVKKHFRRIDRLHPRQNTKLTGTLYIVRCVDDFNTAPTEFTVSMRGITTFATGC